MTATAIPRPVMTLVFALAFHTGVLAQTGTGAPGSLSAADRVEIQQLVARYSHALERGDGGGLAFAGLFTPAGTLVNAGGTITGRSGLAAFASSRSTAARTTTLATNIVVAPARGGASGTVYVIVTESPRGDRDAIVSGGRFEDHYVRTADGWRFGRRQFVPSQLR